MAATEIKTMTCPRCGGSGFIPHYAGIANGVCFGCAGNGEVTYKIAKVDRYSPINAMHCKTLEEAQAFRLEVFGQRFPELVAGLDQQHETKHWIANGMGKIRELVRNLQLVAA